MQIAIAHNIAKTSRLDKNILAALSRTFPNHKLSPHSLDKPQHNLSRHSLIFSIGLDVAATVNCNPGTKHICYLTPNCLSDNPPITEGLTSITQVGFSEEMTDGIFAECSEHILPPVNTQFFSPGNEHRDEACLLIAENGWSNDHQLAVEACKLAEKQLTVFGTDLPSELAEHTHLTCLQLSHEEILKEQYQTNRVLLCPQENSFEITAIEAQACGQPVIAFTESQTAKLIIDAESTGFGTGLLFDELTPESLASTIEELDRRPQRISAPLAWGNAARFSTKRFEQEFDILVHALFDKSLIPFPTAKQVSDQHAPPSDRAA